MRRRSFDRDRDRGDGVDAGADIEVHIDELVLHGFDPAQRHLIADNLAAALGPALAEQGIGAWVKAGRLDRLQAEPVRVGQPPTAADAGRLGRSVAATLK